MKNGSNGIDIVGNCVAHILANNDANQHKVPLHLVDAIDARRLVTTTTQDMMVQRWHDRDLT